MEYSTRYIYQEGLGVGCKANRKSKVWQDIDKDNYNTRPSTTDGQSIVTDN